MRDYRDETTIPLGEAQNVLERLRHDDLAKIGLILKRDGLLGEEGVAMSCGPASHDFTNDED